MEYDRKKGTEMQYGTSVLANTIHTGLRTNSLTFILPYLLTQLLSLPLQDLHSSPKLFCL